MSGERKSVKERLAFWTKKSNKAVKQEEANTPQTPKIFADRCPHCPSQQPPSNFSPGIPFLSPYVALFVSSPSNSPFHDMSSEWRLFPNLPYLPPSMDPLIPSRSVSPRISKLWSKYVSSNLARTYQLTHNPFRLEISEVVVKAQGDTLTRKETRQSDIYLWAKRQEAHCPPQRDDRRKVWIPRC